MIRVCKRHLSIAHDFEPHTVIKKFTKVGSSAKIQKKPQKKVVSDANSENSPPIEKPPEIEIKGNANEMGIQMISQNLFKQIFGNVSKCAVDPKIVSK